MEQLENIKQLIETSPAIGKFVLAIIALAFADLVSGIAYAMKKGESIKASKLKNTTLKIIQFGIAIMVAQALQSLFLENIPLTKIVAGYICLTEAKSVYENIQKTTGLNLWNKISEAATFKSLKPKHDEKNS